jgi:uncharacterized protein YecE (DUF72 family)
MLDTERSAAVATALEFYTKANRRNFKYYCYMAGVHFGIAGWSYQDWKGTVYPADASVRFDELSYLVHFFDVIELNNTFYRIPESKMVESWARRIEQNPHFRFTVKIFQGFTHEEKKIDPDEAAKFVRALEPLSGKNRLGALLAQYPTSFRFNPENMDRLLALKSQFEEFPVVVEFRHRSWVDDSVREALAERQINYCNVDEPVFRHHVKPSAYVTGSVGYIRLHGRNYASWYSGRRDARYDYLYSEEELDQWIPRIEEMDKLAKDVYVIGNNHFRGQAPANILQLKAKTLRAPVDVPEQLAETYVELKKIAKKRDKKGQAELFPDSKGK